ncbi:MAG: DUF2116 family Zn-ribbon domain-containing protein [Bacteroidales bacterium]|nr:DUF2116 family Zn-ribbon domain-containing protein [Bacteroidales bacterium]
MANKTDEKEVCHCMECGDTIRYGRADKKFCSESCKNRWHNREEKSTRGYRLRVRNALARNYDILASFYRQGIDNVEMPVLKALGYDPSFVTSIMHVGKRIEYMCYDFRFRQTSLRLSRLTKISLVVHRSGEKNVSLPDLMIDDHDKSFA